MLWSEKRTLQWAGSFSVALSTEPRNFAWNVAIRKQRVSREDPIGWNAASKRLISFYPEFEPQAQRSIDWCVAGLPLTDEQSGTDKHKHTSTSLTAQIKTARLLLSRALRGHPSIDRRPRSGHWNVHASWARPDLEIDTVWNAHAHPSFKSTVFGKIKAFSCCCKLHGNQKV
jgi:hypothetical protein